MISWSSSIISPALSDALFIAIIFAAYQSYSERQLFEKAYERLKSEFEAVLKVPPEDVQKKMDKALGRSKIIEDNA